MIAAIFFVMIYISIAGASDGSMLRSKIEFVEEHKDLGRKVSLYKDLFERFPLEADLAHGLARALNRTGDYVELVGHLKRWIDKNPDDQMAILMLGDAYVQSEEFDTAIEVWEKTLDTNLVELAMYRKLSDRCESAGLYDGAIHFLEKGRKAFSNNKLFAWELAKLKMRVGAVEEAVEKYVAIVDRDSNLLPAVELEISTLCKLGNSLLFKTLMRKNKEKGNITLVKMFGECSLSMGQSMRGYQVVSEVAKQLGDSELMFQFGTKCEKRGFLEAAARSYSFLATNFDDFSNSDLVLRKSVEIWLNMGDVESAFPYLEKLLIRSADKPEVQKLVVEFASHDNSLGNRREKVATMLKSVARSSIESTLVYRALGFLADEALKSGRLNDAMSYLNRMGKIRSEEDHELGFRHAELLYFTSGCSEVTAKLKTLVQTDVDHIFANDAIELMLTCEEYGSKSFWSNLVRAQLLERRALYAESESEWAIVFANVSSSVKEELMLLRARSAIEPTRALKYFSHLIEEFPKGVFSIEGRLDLVDLYHKSGEYRKALTLSEESLLAAPNGFRVPEFRLRIQRLRKELVQIEATK